MDCQVVLSPSACADLRDIVANLIACKFDYTANLIT
jgi:hypothetical protein